MRDKILSLVVNWLMIMMMNDVNILYCCNSEPEYLDPAEVLFFQYSDNGQVIGNSNIQSKVRM